MKVGRILGVQVKVNSFFLLILVVYGATGYLTEALLVYGAALLHEIAHAVVACSYGLKIEEIELLPFGGVARIKDLDLSTWDPKTEVAVALAGPVENLVLAGAAWILAGYGVWNISLAGLFLQANLAVAAFNLLPAWPLDGGRILRAYLAQRLSWRQATEIAARLGQALGAVLVCLGLVLMRHGLLFFNIAVLGGFLWAVAATEERWAGLVLLRYLAHKRRGLQTGEVVKGEVLAAAGETTLRDLTKRFVAGRYHLVYVLDKDHKIMAIISEDEVIMGLFTYGPDMTLSRLVRRN
ncbi:MAG TPA: peptidase M50 [Firmicutes bacterium]|nr:peptidase M50 [Bacillota bacterium]